MTLQFCEGAWIGVRKCSSPIAGESLPGSSCRAILGNILAGGDHKNKMPLREGPAKSKPHNDGPEDDPTIGGAEIPRLSAPSAAESHLHRPADATTSFPSRLSGVNYFSRWTTTISPYRRQLQALPGVLIVADHRHFQVPDLALGSPAKDTSRIRDASLATGHGTLGLRPLAQTPVKGKNSRNFRHWSLKPHTENCGSCRWTPGSVFDPPSTGTGLGGKLLRGAIKGSHSRRRCWHACVGFCADTQPRPPPKVGSAAAGGLRLIFACGIRIIEQLPPGPSGHLLHQETIVVEGALDPPLQSWLRDPPGYRDGKVGVAGAGLEYPRAFRQLNPLRFSNV